MRHYPLSQHRSAFSLIEMLAAVSVLTVLAVMVAQITLAVARGTKQSIQPVDSAAQARLVFDRITWDLRKMPKREDLDYIMGHSPDHGDFLRFFSLSNCLTDNQHNADENRSAGIIAYRMGDEDPTSDSTKPALLRGSRAVYWSGSFSSEFMGLEQLSVGGPWTPVPLPPVDSTSSSNFPNGSYDVLASGVFHADLCYVLREDYTHPDTGNFYKAGAILASPPIMRVDGRTYIAIQKVKALILGLAIIDLENRKLATPEQLESLASELPSMLDGQRPLDRWTKLRTLNFDTAVPPPVRASLRGYERTIELP